MDPRTYHLLYEDRDGSVIGVDEMQLLEEPIAERVPALRELLGSDDGYVAFQAAQILAAWGDADGIAYFERLVADWPAEGPGYYAHRIHDYDNTADLVAEAVHVYLLSGGDQGRVTRLFGALLGLYGPLQFESRLKDALLRRGDPALADAVRQAVLRAANLGRPYLASQLLPVLARWRGDEALPLLDRFAAAADDRPSPRLNVAEALRYLPPADARPRLERLAADPDAVVAATARESLSALSS